MFQALNQLHHQPLWHRTTPVASGLCLKALVAWTQREVYKKITSTLTMYIVDIYIVDIQLILGVQWMVLASSFRLWQENSDCEVILGGIVREFMLRSYGFISRDHPKQIAGIQNLTLLSLRSEIWLSYDPYQTVGFTKSQSSKSLWSCICLSLAQQINGEELSLKYFLAKQPGKCCKKGSPTVGRNPAITSWGW